MNDTAMKHAAIDSDDDLIAAKRQAHRANLARYARLLATELTQIERDYIHRRVREERLALEALARDDELAPGAMGLESKQLQRPWHRTHKPSCSLASSA
jgi:hypothetical protein